MPLQYAPKRGQVVMCDFRTGFEKPEPVKKRPVLVMAPPIRARGPMSTVVVLSTTAPDPVMPYHVKIDLPDDAPDWFEKRGVWVKGDLILAVGLQRLDLPRTGRGTDGKRRYFKTPVTNEHLKAAEAAVLYALGVSALT